MTGAEHEAVAVQGELKARLQRLEKSHQETFQDLSSAVSPGSAAPLFLAVMSSVLSRMRWRTFGARLLS